jgi:hypothetical protein
MATAGWDYSDSPDGPGKVPGRAAGLAAFGRGLFWAAAFGIVAFFYGFYGIASGWLGLWTLVVPAVASVGVLGMFRSSSKGIAWVNCEMCLLAIWYGHLSRC